MSKWENLNARLTLDMWINVIIKCAIPETHEKSSICPCFMTPFWSCSGNPLKNKLTKQKLWHASRRIHTRFSNCCSATWQYICVYDSIAFLVWWHAYFIPRLKHMCCVDIVVHDGLDKLLIQLMGNLSDLYLLIQKSTRSITIRWILS